jgi:excisionase family DNA binding protein
VAEIARIHVRTVSRAIKCGELRAGGTAGRVLIHREWFDEWLERRTMTKSRA